MVDIWEISIWLGSDQNFHFFNTLTHLSALQNCAVFFLTNLQLFCALQNLFIELCSALKIFQNNLRFFSKLTRSFVAIE